MPELELVESYRRLADVFHEVLAEQSLDALLVRPMDAAREQPIFENFTDEDNAVYILSFITRNSAGSPILEPLRGTVWGPRRLPG